MVIWIPSLLITGAVGQATTHQDASEDPIDKESPEGAVAVEGAGSGCGSAAGTGLGGAFLSGAAAMRISPDCESEAFESRTVALNHLPQVTGARMVWIRGRENPVTPARATAKLTSRVRIASQPSWPIQFLPTMHLWYLA